MSGGLFEKCLALLPAEGPDVPNVYRWGKVDETSALQCQTITPVDERVRTCFNIAACSAILQDSSACEAWLNEAFRHLFWVWDSQLAFGSESERGRFIALAYGDIAVALRSLMMLGSESWTNVFNIVCKTKGAMYQMQAIQHVPSESSLAQLRCALAQARRSMSQTLLTGHPGLIDCAREQEFLEKELLQALHKKECFSPLSHLNVDDVARKLKLDEVLVEYVYFHGYDLANLQSRPEPDESGDYGVFVVASPDSGLPTVQFRKLGCAQHINRSVANFRDVILTPSRWLQKERLKDARLRHFLDAGMLLTEQLVQPIFELTRGSPVRTWFIAADAELCRLPFVALPMSNDASGLRYLLDEETSWCFLRSSGDLVLDESEGCPMPCDLGVSVLAGDPNFDLKISVGDISHLRPDRTHHGVLCDACYTTSKGVERDLEGVRYKCNNCPDFDLCEEHFQRREQSHDALVPHGSAHTFTAIEPPGCRRSQSVHPVQEGLRSLSFESLTGTHGEVLQLAELFAENQCQTKVLLGDDAVASQVLAVVRPPILHLATHGFFLSLEDSPSLPAPTKANEARPWKKSQSKASPEVSRVELSLAEAAVKDPLTRTGLAFAGAKDVLSGEAPLGDDFALVTAADVRGMDLHSTQLVTLSACETGLGHVYPGESVWGLVRGFRLAGAGAVVATLWQVPDQEHSDLMLDFYRHLFAGETKVAALKSAQRAMRERFPDVPWIWASVVLYGCPKALRIRQ